MSAQKIPFSSIPDVTQLLKAAAIMNCPEARLFSKDGQFIVTGLAINDEGCVGLVMKHASSIDWKA